MDLNTKILDENGKVAIINRRITKKVKGKEVVKLQKEDMTVGQVILTCLLTKGEDINPSSHSKRFELWKNIKDGEAELSYSDKNLIKKIVAEKMEILVSAQVIENL